MTKRVLKLLTLSVCLLMLSAASVMAEDPVYFADANLKAAVESELGITDPTPTDMLALTILDAESVEESLILRVSNMLLI